MRHHKRHEDSEEDDEEAAEALGKAIELAQRGPTRYLSMTSTMLSTTLPPVSPVMLEGGGMQNFFPESDNHADVVPLNLHGKSSVEVGGVAPRLHNDKASNVVTLSPVEDDYASGVTSDLMNSLTDDKPLFVVTLTPCKEE